MGPKGVGWITFQMTPLELQRQRQERVGTTLPATPAPLHSFLGHSYFDCLADIGASPSVINLVYYLK